MPIREEVIHNFTIIFQGNSLSRRKVDEQYKIMLAEWMDFKW